MSFLEEIPNEIFIQITNNLRCKDLKTCRLASSLMREKIDKNCNVHMCIIFNEKSERDFVAKKKPPLIPPFIRMRIGNVSYFINSNEATLKNKTQKLRKEYFQNITELEMTEFVPKHYFYQILKLTKNLRNLKLSSAVLGGTKDLFGKEIQRNIAPVKQRPMLFIRRALPQSLIQNMIKRHENTQTIQQSRKNRKWNKLEQLYIKLDYISPSTPNFSPHWLVENVQNVQFLPVASLNVFALTVEKSKEAEMFYFTINSLLSIIPVAAYSSLKSVSVVSPKCRPISQQETVEQLQKSKRNFSRMQLSNLTVKVLEGHTYQDVPEKLLAILGAQQSLKYMSIRGIGNSHKLKWMH